MATASIPRWAATPLCLTATTTDSGNSDSRPDVCRAYDCPVGCLSLRLPLRQEDRAGLWRAGCDRFIWPRQDGYFRPHFMTRRAPVAVICGPTFNVGFITGWMRRKAGLDGVESGVVRADSKGRPG